MGHRMRPRYEYLGHGTWGRSSDSGIDSERSSNRNSDFFNSVSSGSSASLFPTWSAHRQRFYDLDYFRPCLSTSQLSVAAEAPSTPVEEDFYTQSLQFGAVLQSTLNGLHSRSHAEVAILEYRRKKAKKRGDGRARKNLPTSLSMDDGQFQARAGIPKDCREALHDDGQFQAQVEIPTDCREALHALDCALESEGTIPEGEKDITSLYTLDESRPLLARKSSTVSLYDHALP